jgi:ABC-2 type transport system permease protein
MRFLQVVIRKDLARMARDPASLLISVLIPIFVGVMLKLISGGGGHPVAKLLVADQDKSFLSSILVGAMSQGPLAEMVTTQEVDETEGRARMDRGKASGLLIVPKGFGRSVLDRTPAVLTLVTNPSQRILPGILEESLSTMVGGLNLAGNVFQGTLDPLLDRLQATEGVPADALVAEFSVAANQLVRRVEPYLMPPAIQVETVNLEEPKEGAPERSFGDIFFPSMFFLAVVFVAQSLSDDLWKEKARGTLRRNLTTPGRLSLFLLGKILAAGVFLLAVCAVALSVARWGLTLPFTGIPLAVLWAALSGLFMFLLFTTLQLLAGSQRGGHMLTNAVTFPLAMVGGAFFPFEAMPTWLAAIGKKTPNGWALLRLREILDGAADPARMGLTLAGLLAISGVFFLLTLARLRRFARSA